MIGCLVHINISLKAIILMNMEDRQRLNRMLFYTVNAGWQQFSEITAIWFNGVQRFSPTPCNGVYTLIFMIFISRTGTNVHVWLKHNRKVAKRNVSKLLVISEADAKSVMDCQICKFCTYSHGLEDGFDFRGPIGHRFGKAASPTEPRRGFSLCLQNFFPSDSCFQKDFQLHVTKYFIVMSID